MSAWYIEKGPQSDVVLSSRVRLARNFKDYPFPFKMNAEDATKILNSVKSAVLNSSKASNENFSFIDIKGLSSIDRQALVEKHLISPDLAGSTRESGALISKDEKVSIMINEEDHLRLQCMFPGMQLENAWDTCDKLDTLLEESIDFAFSNKHGYLTCCPTNLGTGMRASAMLHLPALMMTGYIRTILEGCNKIGIAVRGLYGENSEASGNIFQISNQVTLGQSEKELLLNIENITTKIIEQERVLRGELYKQDPYRFEDKIFRSMGIMKNARMMASDEAFKMLSDVRLGLDMGIIKDITTETLNEIMLMIQPASLQKAAQKGLKANERDIKRAELIRNKLRS